MHRRRAWPSGSCPGRAALHRRRAGSSGRVPGPQAHRAMHGTSVSTRAVSATRREHGWRAPGCGDVVSEDEPARALRRGTLRSRPAAFQLSGDVGADPLRGAASEVAQVELAFTGCVGTGKLEERVRRWVEHVSLSGRGHAARFLEDEVDAKLFHERKHVAQRLCGRSIATQLLSHGNGVRFQPVSHVPSATCLCVDP